MSGPSPRSEAACWRHMNGNGVDEVVHDAILLSTRWLAWVEVCVCSGLRHCFSGPQVLCTFYYAALP